MSWGQMPREYYEERLKDVRESHRFATEAVAVAEERGQAVNAWAWREERKRLAQSYAEFDRKRKGL